MRRTAVPALIADVLAVLAFVVLGKATHGELTDAVGVLVTAAPFLAGVALGWCSTLVRTAPVTLRAGALVLGCTLLVGLIGRAVVTGRLPVTFVLVTVLTLAVLLLGWRAVALVVTRRSRAKSAP
jgi:hypothetical protein